MIFGRSGITIGKGRGTGSGLGLTFGNGDGGKGETGSFGMLTGSILGKRGTVGANFPLYRTHHI